MADEAGYTKIVAKVPDWACMMFASHGYQTEGSIPGFYNGEGAVHFMSRFVSDDRGILDQDLSHLIDTNISIANAKKDDKKNIVLAEDFSICRLNEEDIDSLVTLYESVFKVYPFPIFDSGYIKSTMNDYIQYFGAFKEGVLYAASSAEIDYDAQNAEMTDFARHPQSGAGLNLSYLLLRYMEEALEAQNIKTYYTIARAYSIGMNTTFSRMNYTLAGTLINNTLISDGIESMNVWYKSA